MKKYKIKGKHKVGKYVAETCETSSFEKGLFNHKKSYHKNLDEAKEAVNDRRHRFYTEPFSDGFHSHVYKHMRPYYKRKKE